MKLNANDTQSLFAWTRLGELTHLCELSHLGETNDPIENSPLKQH